MSGVNAYVAGWNRGSWTSGPWNRSAVPIATAVVNTAAPAIVQGVGVNVSVTGSAATASGGAVTITNKNNFSVTGVSATGLTSSVLVWGLITPSQTSSFSNITPSQTPSWDDIAA
tara:strand:+ start:107 stop:451 length:345 start_codon:yes stop_codon:yes gene_type:complete